MKFIQITLDIASWIVLGIIILMVAVTVGSNTNMAGGYRSFLVQSGSMEPTIMTGDIIIVQKKTVYTTGDVVTFDEGSRIVTHRIIRESGSDQEQTYETKGDANRSADEATITREDIVGAVSFTIPKLGYMVAFAKSLPGLIVLILIPAIMLVVNELVKTKKD